MTETATKQTKFLNREEAVAELYRLRAELAEATRDLSEDEYEALVERITHEVNEGLRAHVLRSRGESVEND